MILTDYEKEMQEQAEAIERWKLKKEIKRKLKVLRKKLKGDVTSLPHLQTISENLDRVENPLSPCVQANDELKLNPYKDLNIHISHAQPTRLKQIYRYDPHYMIDEMTDHMILEEMSKDFGRELLREKAIQYRIIDEIDSGMRKFEIMIDVVLPDIPRDNPAKYVDDSPTLPIKKCPG